MDGHELRTLNQTDSKGSFNCRMSVVHVEFAVDIAVVPPYGLRRYEKLISDMFIGQSFGQ
jgi:hypothetical protein